MKRVVIVNFIGLLAIAAIVAAAVQAWVIPQGISQGISKAVSQDQRAVASAALQGPPGWTPVDWPFLNDQFGKGKAFECDASNCGDKIRVTFRAKIGFCNCATGVSDDEELERIGDVGMASAANAPLEQGREIRVGRMVGRSRSYAIGARESRQRLLSLAFNERCDVIVATAQAGDAPPEKIEAMVLRFLNSAYVLEWAETTLGL